MIPKPAEVIDETNASSLPVLLSAEGEQVIRFWLVNQAGVDNFYYSSYQSGVYKLKKVTFSTSDHNQRVPTGAITLLDNYEVYNLGPAPVSTDSANYVLLDALKFDDNSYYFGTLDASQTTPEDIAASMNFSIELTGTLKTLFIMPNLQ